MQNKSWKYEHFNWAIEFMNLKYCHGYMRTSQIIYIHTNPYSLSVTLYSSSSQQERDSRKLWDWQDLSRGNNQGPSNAQRWKAEKCGDRQKEKNPLTEKAREIMLCRPASIMVWVCNSSVSLEFSNGSFFRRRQSIKAIWYLICWASITVHNYST